MINIHVTNEGSRTLRRIWFVTEGSQPELRSRWSVKDSPDIVEDIHRVPCNDRNHFVTKSCDTETIAICP
jgi:hypothetical protein